MEALSKHFQTVALDMRGFNLSDKPAGVDAYRMAPLMQDLDCLLDHFGVEKAIIVGHDWGGGLAWRYAMENSHRIERLIIINSAHPVGIMRELAHNPKQQKGSEYTLAFQQPGSHEKIKVEELIRMVGVKSEEDKALYREALERSDKEAMMNYYKANFARFPYQEFLLPPNWKVKCPVFLIHGLKDWAITAETLNNCWEWVEGELSILTLPQAGHWSHQSAAERVNRALLRWLDVG